MQALLHMLKRLDPSCRPSYQEPAVWMLKPTLELSEAEPAVHVSCSPFEVHATEFSFLQ